MDAPRHTSHAIFREAPRTSNSVRVTPFVQDDDAERMRFFVWKDVLEELRYACDFHAPRSSVCVLTGLYGLAPDGPFLELTGFQDFLAFDEVDDAALHKHVQRSLEELISDRATSLDAVNPSGIGLMWHAHGSEGRLHESAMRLHLSLFNVPYQFILALDTQADAIALYARRPHHPFFSVGLHLIEHIEQGSALHMNAHEEE